MTFLRIEKKYFFLLFVLFSKKSHIVNNKTHNNITEISKSLFEIMVKLSFLDYINFSFDIDYNQR